MFTIHMGIPEMEAFWDNLEKKVMHGKMNLPSCGKEFFL